MNEPDQDISVANRSVLEHKIVIKNMHKNNKDTSESYGD